MYLKNKIGEIIYGGVNGWGEKNISVIQSVYIANKILALIDGQRCVWKKDADLVLFRTSCGKVYGLDWDYAYNPMCPNCGFQIEVKDDGSKYVL